MEDKSLTALENMRGLHTYEVKSDIHKALKNMLQTLDETKKGVHTDDVLNGKVDKMFETIVCFEGSRKRKLT